MSKNKKKMVKNKVFFEKNFKNIFDIFYILSIAINIIIIDKKQGDILISIPPHFYATFLFSKTSFT